MTDYNAIAAALLASKDWRSNMDVPGGIPTGGPRPAPTLSQGPAPTGYDKVFDAAYGALGGTPDKRRLAETLTQGFDLATLGMATGAYDGGRHFAATGEPALLAAAMMPGARVPGAAAKMAEKAAEKGIKAFHGSPHDFDKFDLSKIGTGEGAQAFGHGLYFAEVEDVAKAYRDSTTIQNSGFKLNGVDFDSMRPQDKGWQQSAHDAFAMAHGDGDMAISMLDNKNPLDFIKAVNQINRWRDSGALSFPKGNMYEVNIKADPEQFLDWDKPLSQQSDRVRREIHRLANGEILPEWTGEQGFRSVASQMMSSLDLERPEISKALREAGIPGIKYLDQGSRSAGEGSRNYVVFDDSIIEILRKYGLLPPAAAGGYAAAQSSPAEAKP